MAAASFAHRLWASAALLSLSFAVDSCHGARFLGNLTIRGDWQVVSNFAVDVQEPSEQFAGRLDGSVFVHVDAVLVGYDDSPDSWPLLKVNSGATCEMATKLVSDGGYAKIVIPLRGGTENRVGYDIPGKDRASVWEFAVAKCVARRGRLLPPESSNHFEAEIARGGLGKIGSLDHGRSLADSPLFHQRHRYNKYVSPRFHAYHGHIYHRLGARASISRRVGAVWVDLHIVRTGAGGWTAEFPADEVYLLPGTLTYLLFFTALAWVVLAEYIRSTRVPPGHSSPSLLLFYIIAGICFAEWAALLLSFCELVAFGKSSTLFSASFARCFCFCFADLSLNPVSNRLSPAAYLHLWVDDHLATAARR